MNDFGLCLGLAFSHLWVSTAVGGRGLGIHFSHAVYHHLPRTVPSWWITVFVDQMLKRSWVWADLDFFQVESNK